MEKFTASRLAEDNKLFPPEIHLDEYSLTVKLPKLFGGKTQSFDYRDITSVSIETPMIGYSTITFYSSGTKISAHGFTKSEVKRIKEAIEGGKIRPSAPIHSHTSASNSSNSNTQTNSISSVLAGAFADRFKSSHEANQETRKVIIKKVGSLFNAKKINEAGELHNKLTQLRDDINLAQGKKDEALEMVKKLIHDSNMNMPDSEVKYVDYWSNKRKEYINKITS